MAMLGENSGFDWRKAMYNFPQMDVYFVRFLPEQVQRFISDGKNYGFIQYAGTTLSIPANSAEKTI